MDRLERLTNIYSPTVHNIHLHRRYPRCMMGDIYDTERGLERYFRHHADKIMKCLHQIGMDCALDFFQQVRPYAPFPYPGETIVYVPPDTVKKLEKVEAYHVTTGSALLQGGEIYPQTLVDKLERETLLGPGLLQVLTHFLAYSGAPLDWTSAVWGKTTPDAHTIEHIRRVGEDPAGYRERARQLFFSDDLRSLSPRLRRILEAVTDDIKREVVGTLELREIFDQPSGKVITNDHELLVEKFMNELQGVYDVCGYRTEVIKEALRGTSPFVNYNKLCQRVEQSLTQTYLAKRRSRASDLFYQAAINTGNLDLYEKYNGQFPTFPVVCLFRGHPLVTGGIKLLDGSQMNIALPDQRNPIGLLAYRSVSSLKPERVFVPCGYMSFVDALFPGIQVSSIEDLTNMIDPVCKSYYDKGFYIWAKENEICYAPLGGQVTPLMHNLLAPPDLLDQHPRPVQALPPDHPVNRALEVRDLHRRAHMVSAGMPVPTSCSIDYGNQWDLKYYAQRSM